jgi:hypothetical protein
MGKGSGLMPFTAAGESYHKYKNTAIMVDGFRFDSKLEADWYKNLKAQRERGEVAWFIRQVPFDVAPSVRYFVDFLVVYAGGGIQLQEVKGYMTPLAKVKITVVEERYGVIIRILKRGDIPRA